MSRYLVTGGAGFIGSHLVDSLVTAGEHVRVVDDLSTGHRENLSSHGADAFEFIEDDLSAPGVAERVVEGVEYVLHIAAIPSVPRSVKDPVGSHRANVDATVLLLEAARAAEVKRVVFASSSSVYGDSPTLPKHEKMPTSPLSPYALQKLIGEQYMGLYFSLYGLETVSLRFFNGLCCNFRAATSGWTTFGKHRTGSPIMPSDNPFKWRQFEPALILQCVRWYLRYALSYRDLEDMMRERGLCVDHTTIYRWVQRYAPEIDKRCRPFLRRTNDSYRIDETYVRVAGAWTYLYRGVDSNGDTLDFLLRATRDRKAAIAFFRKTLGAAHTTPPRVVTVDKNPAYPVAFEAVRHEGLVRPRSNLRQCKYLNNIIEQDHRFIKRRTRPMLGFKLFTTAWRTLRGIEIMHALRKGQARWMAKGDVVGQTQLIHKVFGLAA